MTISKHRRCIFPASPLLSIGWVGTWRFETIFVISDQVKTGVIRWCFFSTSSCFKSNPSCSNPSANNKKSFWWGLAEEVAFKNSFWLKISNHKRYVFKKWPLHAWHFIKNLLHLLTNFSAYSFNLDILI